MDSAHDANLSTASLFPLGVQLQNAGQNLPALKEAFKIIAACASSSGQDIMPACYLI